MSLLPVNQTELRKTIATFSEVDQGLILEYCAGIQKILNDLSARGQELTTTGAAAGEAAVQRIRQFIGESGANRLGFQSDMDGYIDMMQANRSFITQVPRDAIQVYGKAMATGVISTGTLYAIAWWNFTSTLSTLLALAASNPLAATALGGISMLQLQEFSLTDYLKLAFMERPQLPDYDEYTINAGLQRMTENTAVESSGYMSYVYSLVDTARPVVNSVADTLTGEAAAYTDKMARLKYEETVTTVDQLFNVRDQFLKITLILTAMMILLMVMLWGTRYVRQQRFRKRTATGVPIIEMLQSPMGRVPRRKSRSRRMNTAVKRKGSPKRRKSTRRKSRSPKRKSTRRKSTRRKSSSKRKSKSKRRKSRRKSKSKRRKSMPKRKSKSKRRKSRRKSKSKRRKSMPKRKSKSKRRKSRRKSKSPKRKSKSMRRKSTRKGQVLKTSRRAYMDLKTKPRRKSRSRRRKDMM